MANNLPTSLAFARNTLRQPPIDYTSRDTEAIFQDSLRLIPFTTPEWTDFNFDDLGIAFLRLVSFIGDGLHFYVDRAANEGTFATAITRRGVINHLKLIGFQMRSAVPASVDLDITLQSPLAGDLLIPAGFPVTTSGDDPSGIVRFETTQDVVVRAGQINVSVSAAEGTTGGEDVGVSTGQTRQRFTLVAKPIIDGTLRIFVDEGIGERLWTPVQTFVSSGPLDQHYVIQRDDQDVITIFFGDNAQGKIPDPGATIRSEYRTGGGVIGNVGANTLVTAITTLTFQALPVPLSVTNPLSASGGEDRMSIEEAKILGPLSLRTLNRAVTPDDWVILAESFPGVAKASIAPGGPLVSSGAPCCCVLQVCIAPKGGGQPSSELIRDVTEFLEGVKMIGTCFTVRGPEYVPVLLETSISVAPNFAVEKVAADAAAAVSAFFDPASNFMAFNTDVFLSDIVSMLDEIPGVDHVDLGSLTIDPVASYEIWSGDCTVGPVDVGTRVQIEKWSVVFVTRTQFSVRGSVSGIQARRGEVGVPYVSDNGEVSFTVSCGGVRQQCAGDRATFVTSLKASNVPIGSCQIPEKSPRSLLTFVGGSRIQRECVGSA